MPSRLGDRLKTARHQHFVGREAEQSLFLAALARPELGFNILLIFGPGGVGKTSLLHEFAYICEESQITATYLDCHNLDPRPEAFEKALQQSLGLDPSLSPLDALANIAQHHVLLIDTYERLTPLDTWFGHTFLPQLPDNVLLVLAGRQQPLSSLLADPGWQALTRVLPLDNLSLEESRLYLSKWHIPVEQQTTILDFTHGHPLALSLVIDIYTQRTKNWQDLQPQMEQDIIHTLLKHLIQKVPGPAHRAALEACALVRVTTEALLAEMLARPDVHDLFDWLRHLSFIETGRAGLFPHDLVRDALTADLRWRNPDWYTELHRRARTYYADHLQQSAGQTQQRLILDYIFLHRENAMVRPFFEWQASGGALPDSMQPDDIPVLMAMVAKHEGAASAKLAQYWFERQPENILVLRGVEKEPAGFLAMIRLDDLRPDDAQIDPAIQATRQYLQHHAPLREGERATLFRFWMAHDTYQAVSPTQSLIFINILRHYLMTPRLAFTFFPCADADFWAPMCIYTDLVRIPTADFKAGGRQYGVYGHDWRITPPMAWLSLLIERETAMTIDTPPTLALNNAPPLPQPDFERAVWDALRSLRSGQASSLYTNPLLRLRLVTSKAGAKAGEAECAVALRKLLTEAAETLQVSPRDLKFYRALYHTYFQPAKTQEQAAELLNLPFSTFRRHLKRGIKRVADHLWQQQEKAI